MGKLRLGEFEGKQELHQNEETLTPLGSMCHNQMLEYALGGVLRVTQKPLVEFHPYLHGNNQMIQFSYKKISVNDSLIQTEHNANNICN